MIQDVMQQQRRGHLNDILIADEIMSVTVKLEIVSAPMNDGPVFSLFVAKAPPLRADLAGVVPPRSVGKHVVTLIFEDQPLDALFSRVTLRRHIIPEPANRAENSAGGRVEPRLTGAVSEAEQGQNGLAPQPHPARGLTVCRARFCGAIGS